MQFNNIPILSHIYVIFLLASASSATLVGQTTKSMPKDLPKANSTEFKSMLYRLEAYEEFRSAEDSEKAKAIIAMRDKYKSTHILDEMDERAIDAFSKGASDYNKGSRYKVNSEALIKSQIEYPDVDSLPKEVALGKIKNFRIQSEQAAETFDSLLKDDYLFDLQCEANELERRVRGRETGILTDKVVRIVQGAVGSLLRILKFDEAAEDIENTCFSENPKFDSPSTRIRPRTTPW